MWYSLYCIRYVLVYTGYGQERYYKYFNNMKDFIKAIKSLFEHKDTYWEEIQAVQRLIAQKELDNALRELKEDRRKKKEYNKAIRQIDQIHTMLKNNIDKK
jgi:5'-deoxynucleotidase YfbR-like HD superfamily hydrolase